MEKLFFVVCTIPMMYCVFHLVSVRFLLETMRVISFQNTMYCASMILIKWPRLRLMNGLSFLKRAK